MTPQFPNSWRPAGARLVVGSLVLLTTAAVAPVEAATAHDLYTAALTHERELRAPADESASLEQLRGAIAAYTEIVRQYPRSDYSDNALWQAAGLAIQAFDRHREPADRDNGMRLLRMLAREYPLSSLAPRVEDRVEQIRRLDGPVRLRAIDRASLDDVVRVSIELDDEVPYSVERLEGPPRLFFDFKGTVAVPPLLDARLAFDDGDLVREIRLGRHPEHTTRVVLDIEAVDSYSVYVLYHPYRLVVDTVRPAAMQAARATPDTPVHAGDTGPPVPEGPKAPPPPAETADVRDAATSPVAPVPSADESALLPVPEGWVARRLDPLPSTLESEDNAGVDPEPAPVIDLIEPHGDAPGWRLHDVLYPNLSAPPSPGHVAHAQIPDTAPSAVRVTMVPVRIPDVVEPPTFVFPVSMVEIAAPSAHALTVEVDYQALSSMLATMTPAREAVTDIDHDLVVGPPHVLTPPGRGIPQLPALDHASEGSNTAGILSRRAWPAGRRAPASLSGHSGDTPPAPQTAELTAPDAPRRSFGDPVSRAGSETPAAHADGLLSLGRQLGLGVARVVIDPGHGGYDPGAQTGELNESALVLDVARRLETRLKAETGIEVVLTRRGDTYMPLRARTELANRVGADLFLSIHANAASNGRARGIETYYLDLTSDPTVQALAARENSASREGMHDLPDLVRSITLRNKRDESRDFAETVQRNLLRGLRELHPAAQDLGVKQAPFVVLIGANMPSVLAEVSFLTNQEDAAFLATDAYRDRIAVALMDSILEYQRALRPAATFADGNN